MATTSESPSSLSTQTDSEIATLMLELQTERDRRTALEIEVHKLKQRSTASYQEILCSEVDSIVGFKKMLVHGPDTIQRFEEFSMSRLIDELQSYCPELCKLVQQLGSTQRNARADTLPDEELKGIMAICTLLNARSARVKGLQLIISLMLVARATGRQV